MISLCSKMLLQQIFEEKTIFSGNIPLTTGVWTLARQGFILMKKKSSDLLPSFSWLERTDCLTKLNPNDTLACQK